MTLTVGGLKHVAGEHVGLIGFCTPKELNAASSLDFVYMPSAPNYSDRRWESRAEQDEQRRRR